MQPSRKLPLVAGVFTLLALVLCFQTAVAQEELQCRNQELNMTDSQRAVIMSCAKEIAGVDSVWRLPLEKIACFGVCILQRKNLLTDDGKLDHDKILNYIQDVMKPDDVKKPLVDGTEKCLQEHGPKIRNDNDPNCITFTDVGQCVHDVFLGICVEG